MYCDSATIVGPPCDGVISVMFGNSSANSAAGTDANSAAGTDANSAAGTDANSAAGTDANSAAGTDAGVDSPDANNGGSDGGVCIQQVSDRTLRIERLPRMTVIWYGHR